MTELVTSIPRGPVAAPAATVAVDEIQQAPQRRPWTRQYREALLAVDAAAITVSIAVGFRIRFAGQLPGPGFSGFAVFLGLGWLVALQNSGAYDIRHLAVGPTEAKAVLRGSAIAVSVVAVLCYATQISIARGFVIGVIPLGVCLLLTLRGCVRFYVMRRRNRGEWSHRILAVGSSESVGELLLVTSRARSAGLTVVGACVEDAPIGSELAPGVPVLAGVTSAASAAAEVAADVVAVTGGGLGTRSVRELGWALEGTGRGLVLAPSLTEIAGPRVSVSPVDGLPLMWVEQPQLGRVPRAVKRAMDVVIGSLLLSLAIPILLIAMCAIRMESRGSALFRQRRLGANGSEFTMLKLRSMHAGAEQCRSEILDLNEQDGGGVLFKIYRDPRLTRVGGWIRQFSIDELPQLVHVVSGKMSLVGPRPLAACDSDYTGPARRRLMVRPGLTGLWQVSGRSDLTWDDAVRLDLFYVENWSIGLDLVVLARTILAVVRRKGAY